MGPFQVGRTAFSHKRNNAIPLPQDMRNPPVESWFMVNATDFGIFSSLNRGRLLEVSKVLPRRRAIIPLAAELPANGCALQVGLAISADNFLVRELHSCRETSMVNSILQ
jgi:hypothetical protein